MPDSQKAVARLRDENRKLKAALAAVIPWVGSPADGPQWATATAKARNKAMCESAIAAARACFPDDYNEFRELAESN